MNPHIERLLAIVGFVIGIIGVIVGIYGIKLTQQADKKTSQFEQAQNLTQETQFYLGMMKVLEDSSINLTQEQFEKLSQASTTQIYNIVFNDLQSQLGNGFFLSISTTTCYRDWNNAVGGLDILIQNQKLKTQTLSKSSSTEIYFSSIINMMVSCAPYDFVYKMPKWD